MPFKKIFNRTQDVKRFEDAKPGVKGLVDSGITTIPTFFIHPPDNRDMNCSVPFFSNVDLFHSKAASWMYNNKKKACSLG
ncbi:hypothetical protein ACOSP7_019427 [Xanthoceras sorbifolium]